jgi:SHS2 domain-containing protein
MTSRHEFTDHTSELALRIEATSWSDLIAEAVRAVGAELVREGGEAGATPRRVVEVTAADREALLVDLINELIYLAEVERWAPTDPRVTEAGDRSARVECGGVALAGPPSRIKAATFHGLAVRSTGPTVTAEVILDV